MKTTARIALVLGLAVMIAFVVREGAQSIASLLRHAGWLLLLLVPLHVAPLLLDVMGWRLLIPGRSRIRALFLIASIREAINRLLPVANIGGELVGANLLSREGVSGTAAATSVIVEVLLFLFAQYLFLILGVVCSEHHRKHRRHRSAARGRCRGPAGHSSLDVAVAERPVLPSHRTDGLEIARFQWTFERHESIVSPRYRDSRAHVGTWAPGADDHVAAAPH